MADFGLARFINCSIGSTTQAAGTPSYQSPEQLMGKVKIPEACDVYAMGCVLVELFLEKALWSSNNAFEIIYKVTVERLQPSYEELPTCLHKCCCAIFCPEGERATSNQMLKLLISVHLVPGNLYQSIFHVI